MSFKQRWLKWIGDKFTLKFFINTIITICVGFLLRYLIKDYFNVDVINDIKDIVSWVYFLFMIIFSSFSYEVLAEILAEFIKDNFFMGPNYMMPMGGPSGNSLGGNNPNIPSSSGGNAPSGTGGNSSPTFAPTTDEGLISDNQELPLDIRKADWNRPDPTSTPYGTRAMDYSARYGKGEPMDIAMPTNPDKKYIHNLLTTTLDFMNNHVAYNPNPTLSDVLKTLEEKGNRNRINIHDEGEVAFGVYKQIRKIVYNEPQFHRFINNNTDRVEWSKIRAGQNSEFMKYLDRNT
jgi:hypothetical protein